MKPKLLPDAPLKALCSLSEKAMVTGDFDPIYPMLEVLCKDMDKEESLWYAFCYVGHYNIASGAQMFADYPKQVRQPRKKYPIRFQRRNLNPGNEYRMHWNSLWEKRLKYGSLANWLEEGMTGDGEADFNYVRERVLEVRGNGRWAGMKLGEVLKYSTYPHLLPCDMGHRYSAAPRKGLGMFYADPGGNKDDTIAYLDKCGEHLTRVVKRRMSRNLNYFFGVAEMETNLCDFKSMASGKFYSGKCADVVLLTLTNSTAKSKILDPIYKSRAALFDRRVLGELSGWDGVDPSRDRLYSEHGVIPWRWQTLEQVLDA